MADRPVGMERSGECEGRKGRCVCCCWWCVGGEIGEEAMKKGCTYLYVYCILPSFTLPLLNLVSEYQLRRLKLELQAVKDSTKPRRHFQTSCLHHPLDLHLLTIPNPPKLHNPASQSSTSTPATIPLEQQYPVPALVLTAATLALHPKAPTVKASLALEGAALHHAPDCVIIQCFWRPNVRIASNWRNKIGIEGIMRG